MRQFYCVLLTCAVFLCLSARAQSQLGGNIGSPLAVSEILALKSTDGRSHEIEAIALSRSGDVGVLYMVERVSDPLRRGATTSQDGEYLLWKLDGKGRLLYKEFMNKMSNLGPARVEIIPLSAPEDGVVIIGVFEDQFAWSFLRIDGTGKIVKSVKLVNEPGAFEAAVLLPNAKGLLLAGQFGFKGNVWNVDLEGKVIWKKSYDPGTKTNDKATTKDSKSSTHFYGIALAQDNEGFIAAGDFGAIDKVGLGQRSVWLVRCDAAGAVLSETTFPGRSPLICPSGKEGFAVLYGSRASMESESRVCHIDLQLQREWEKRAEFSYPWVDPPTIGAISSRQGFVLAGFNSAVDGKTRRADKECRFFQYDTIGTIVLSTSIPITQKALLGTHVVCGWDCAYVAIQTKGRTPLDAKEASIFEIRLQQQDHQSHLEISVPDTP